MNAVITAVGGYVPPLILDNKKISKTVDTSEQWIEKRTGIKERRIADDDTAVSDLASGAINNLIENYEVDPYEIEVLILATATPDHMLARQHLWYVKKAICKMPLDLISMQHAAVFYMHLN